MDEQRPMTRQDWAAHVADLRRRVGTLGRREAGELLLANALDQIEALSRRVDTLEHELDDLRGKVR